VLIKPEKAPFPNSCKPVGTPELFVTKLISRLGPSAITALEVRSTWKRIPPSRFSKNQLSLGVTPQILASKPAAVIRGLQDSDCPGKAAGLFD
jgi:hypothetical protein